MNKKWIRQWWQENYMNVIYVIITMIIVNMIWACVIMPQIMVTNATSWESFA